MYVDAVFQLTGRLGGGYNLLRSHRGGVGG